MIKLTPLLEIKISNPYSPEVRFKRFLMDWKKSLETKIKPLLKNAYTTQTFDDNLVNTLIQYTEQLYNKHDLEMGDGFKEWIVGIKNESLPINSSGSFYTGFRDMDGLYYTGLEMGIEDEERIDDIINDTLN